MAEITPDRKAYLLEGVADQRRDLARDMKKEAMSKAKEDGFVVNLGKRIETLAMLHEAIAACQIAEEAWTAVGNKGRAKGDEVRESRRTCERTFKSMETTVASDVYDSHENPDLDTVFRHLFICEALRRADEQPVTALGEYYSANPVLSKPETWNGEEFPWVKADD